MLIKLSQALEKELPNSFKVNTISVFDPDKEGQKEQIMLDQC